MSAIMLSMQKHFDLAESELSASICELLPMPEDNIKTELRTPLARKQLHEQERYRTGCDLRLCSWCGSRISNRRKCRRLDRSKPHLWYIDFDFELAAECDNPSGREHGSTCQAPLTRPKRRLQPRLPTRSTVQREAHAITTKVLAQSPWFA